MSNPKVRRVLAMRDYTDADGNEKTFFTRIGTAFATKAGGFTIEFDAVPVSGRCLIAGPDEDREDEAPKKRGARK